MLKSDICSHFVGRLGLPTRTGKICQTTKSRLDRLRLLCFAGLHLSKAAPRISFSVRTIAVELEVAFAILDLAV